MLSLLSTERRRPIPLTSLEMDWLRTRFCTALIFVLSPAASPEAEPGMAWSLARPSPADASRTALMGSMLWLLGVFRFRTEMGLIFRSGLAPRQARRTGTGCLPLATLLTLTPTRVPRTPTHLVPPMMRETMGAAPGLRGLGSVHQSLPTASSLSLSTPTPSQRLPCGLRPVGCTLLLLHDASIGRGMGHQPNSCCCVSRPPAVAPELLSICHLRLS